MTPSDFRTGFVQKSWSRAERLQNLTGHHSKNDCRAFLCQWSLKKGHPPELLDNGLDKRNPGVRAIMAEFEGWKTKGGKANTGKKTATAGDRFEPRFKPAPPNRPSKGNPSKAPRAGAPNLQIDEATLSQIPSDALIEIRAIQRKYNLSTDELHHTVTVLGELVEQLTNTPI